MNTVQKPTDLIVMGKITSAFGIKGWVKVVSFTSSADQLLRYREWFCQREGREQTFKLVQGQVQGKTLVAKLDAIDDRNTAESLAGYEIRVPRQLLPKLGAGEYYWSDLIGLQVINRQGIAFGTVKALMETGANDVLIVEGDRERLVPWIMGQVVLEVSLDNKSLLVDWDANF